MNIIKTKKPWYKISIVLLLMSINGVAYAEIIANSSVTQEHLSRSEMKSIFFGTTTHWIDSRPILLCIDQTKSNERNNFYESVLHKNVRAYRRYWSKKLFSGDSAHLPSYPKTTTKSLTFVAKTDGAICFVSSIPKVLPNNVIRITIID